MTTLHMQTENVHSTSQQMQQAAVQARVQVNSLLRAIQSLDANWTGRSAQNFSADSTEIARRLQLQSELLEILAERLQREGIEWEQVDHNGASAFQSTSPRVLLATLPGIFSGGAGDASWFTSTISPMFAGVAVGQFLRGLPLWLNNILDRFFPAPDLISPVAEADPAVASDPPTTKLGDLMKESPVKETPVVQEPPISEEIPGSTVSAAPEQVVEASPPVESAPAKNNGYDVYYDMPAVSQGTLYGSAACLPTSLSMITEYYHSQNADYKSISPEGLKDMLDPGDGTSGKGVGLNKLNDDLNELGYTQTKNFQSDMDGLKNELANGPVVVNIGVKLVGNPARALDGPGATMHAVVVRGTSSDGVLINDPWSGSEIKLTNDDFQALWKKGENWLQTVRP